MVSLQERLRRVRGGVSPTVPLPAESFAETSPPTEGLAARLRRLAPLRTGMPARGEPDEHALADRLGAEIIAPGVLVLTRSRPLAERHGRFRPADAAARLPALLPEAIADPGGWAVLDTETSGLAGGTGTWAFVCGLARFEDDCLWLRQYLLTRLDAESVFLARLAAELAEATLLLSYNGKSFDLPLLATRFRLCGIAWDGERIAHLDLLHPLRRAFARRWPDCRLGSVETHLLGVRRGGDLPGAEAPAAWLDWLRRGDGGRLGAVLRHNRVDLVSVAALVPALAAVQRAPGAYGADTGAVARHWLGRGDATRALALLDQARATLDPSERLLLASLYRRRGEWSQARELWQRLAADGEPAAIEALAKYHEYRDVDLTYALALAQQLPAGPAQQRRCLRLQRKLRAAGSLNVPAP